MPSVAASKLSAAQVASYARQAGFPESEIATAVAVAHAESGLNPRAHNAVPPDNSYGLWQINMLGSLGPSRRKSLGISSNDALFDPATNARAAYAIWKTAGKSWRPWTTYTHGSYKAFLSDAPGDGSTGTPLDKLPGADKARELGLAAGEKWNISKALNDAIESVRKASWTWLVVLLAIAMIVLGVVILNRNMIRRTTRATIAMTPAGKALATAGVIK